MPTYHKRKFKPKFPEKYQGDVTNIIMRSLWETRFANWCDNNPAILTWSSEETVIPYICATDGRWHRYFLDFRIQVRTKDNSIKTYLVEVKPHKQTLPPEQPKRKTKRYLEESFTFLKNQSKWDAARNYCADRGWSFVIITEKELGIK